MNMPALWQRWGALPRRAFLASTNSGAARPSTPRCARCTAGTKRARHCRRGACGVVGRPAARLPTSWSESCRRAERCRRLVRASLSVGHCAIAIWPYFLAMPKSISISQFLCYICKSSCSPPSGDPYLSDDSQSTFQYRRWPCMVRSPRIEGLW